MIGGEHIGVGGILRTMMKTIANITTNIASLGGDVLTGNIDGDADDRVGRSIMEAGSDLARFGRGRLSPLGSIGWDVLQGRNYIGEDTNTWASIPRQVTEALLPFSVEGRLLGNPRSGWGTLPLEMAGLNIYPIQPWEETNVQRDLTSNEM
jgi:hypothetical protein